MLRMWPSLCSLLLLVPVLASNAEIKINSSKAELSCDTILIYAFPDLCDLEVSRANLTIRGLNLVYWRYRSRKVASPKIPVLMVHGGPAFSHNYLLPMKQQACRGREVVFYDQVGAGESSQPKNVSQTAPWLLTIPYYTEEVGALVQHLGWSSFHLFGSSWGTVVGQAYALLQDPRLKAIVLSGPLSDGQLYGRSQWDEDQGNLGSMPFHVQAVLRELGRQSAFDSALYAAEDTALTSFFTTRTVPIPDCFLKAKPSSATSLQIYVGMQGASEFTVGGVLAKMNFTPQLGEIKNPVLLTHGRYDTMRPPVIDAMYRSLPRVWRALLPRSGHCSMIDDPRLMNDLVGSFYDHAESKSLHRFEIPVEAANPDDKTLTLAIAVEQDGHVASVSHWAAILLSLVIGIGVGFLLPRGPTPSVPSFDGSRLSALRLPLAKQEHHHCRSPRSAAGLDL